MTRFLALDAKTRNALIQGIRTAWKERGRSEMIVSFFEEMELPVVSDVVEKTVQTIGKDTPKAKALLAVLEALRSSKPKGGDWRLTPRASRKQVANADGRKHR